MAEQQGTVPIPALQYLLEDKFLGKYNVVNYNKALTATPALFVPAYMERVAYVIVNQSDSPCFISFGYPINTSYGVILGANGGSLSTNYRDDAVIPGIEVYAWANVGSGQISMWSVERYGF